MHYPVLQSPWLTAIVLIFVAQSAYAQPAIVPHLSEIARPATTVKDWLAQSPAVTQITGVRIKQTSTGI